MLRLSGWDSFKVGSFFSQVSLNVCGRQLLNWLPMVPTSWIHTLVLLHPVECGLDLITCFWWIEYGKRIECGMSLPKLGYRESGFHHAHPLLLTLMETSCHAVSCPVDRQGTEEGFWPSQRGTESSQSRVSELGRKLFFPVRPWDDSSFCWYQECRLVRNPEPQRA